jgi:hypothetical protein
MEGLAEIDQAGDGHGALDRHGCALHRVGVDDADRMAI